jgi:hypothetical protein
MKRTILMLTIVSLLAVPTMAVKEPGDVPAPTWEDPAVYPDGDNIVFDWTDVAAAEKYSLCIEGVLEVDYTIDTVEYLDVEVEFSLCFGTSDRTDGGEMGDSDLAMPGEDFFIAIFTAIDEAMLDQLGISLGEEDDMDWMELIAKVKGLDPHEETGKKRQNNPFSGDLDLLAIF